MLIVNLYTRCPILRCVCQLEYSSGQMQYSGCQVEYSRCHLEYNGCQLEYSGCQLEYSGSQLDYTAAVAKINCFQLVYSGTILDSNRTSYGFV